MNGATSIVFAPLVPLWLLGGLGGLAAVLVGFAAYKRARGTIIRAAAIAVLAGLLANPALKEELREPLKDIAVMVIDESPSQAIKPRPTQTAATIKALTEKLARDKDLELRVVRAGAPAPAATAGGTSGNDTERAAPRDRGTRLFEALGRTLGDIPPQRFAGAIMITDGQVHDAPKQARDMGLTGPLHSLLTGTSTLRDRRLVIEQAANYGIVGETAVVTLRIQESGGGTGRARVSLARDGGENG
jgi:hypothetical protein